ncbi:MAG: DNA mismatch repair protein MutS [Myxococcales bacterium]|nr:DNA mismatch repair protein MutS [Myxococcales bacterium]
MSSREDDPQAHYGARREALLREGAELDRRDVRLSWLRGVGLLATVGGAIGVAVLKEPLGWLGVAAVGAAFVAFVVQHARVATRQFDLRWRLELCDRAEARLEGRFRSAEQRGDRFVAAAHPYADDLDLFGAGSLFEQLNTTETRAAEERCAGFLLAPASPETVHARQRAVRELAAAAPLREELALEARRVGRVAGPTPAFDGWLAGATPARTSDRLALGLSAVLGCLTVGLLVAQAYTTGLARYAGLTAAAQLVLVYARRSRLEAAISPVCDRDNPLGRYARLVAVAERARFEDETLTALVAPLAARRGSRRASQHMARLETLVGLAAARHNAIGHFLLNVLCGWDAWCAHGLDAWRREHGPRVGSWLVALADLEALACLGTYAHDHPHFAWPRVEPERDDRGRAVGHFEARDLAHPLLAARGAVANDVALTTSEPALMITGSNMSGKSTLLRSVGVAAVMAQAGLPVFARSLAMGPLAVRPSIRVADSLDEGASRFFREVEKLKRVVDSLGPEGAEDATPVLFLLDEVLHGTNSRERILGASAVVRELVRRGAIGAASSHDLGLVRLESETGGRVRNTHFEDHIEAGKMVFDYRMRPGPVATSNALRLMRAVGLDLDYRDDAAAAPTGEA